MLRLVSITLTSAVLLLGCGEDEPSGAAGDTSGGTSQSVEIVEFRFEPDELMVSPGTTVTWTNSDDFAHTVTGTEGMFDSDDIEAGGTFEHTFEAAGTFTYFCDIHNYMKATVVVG